MPTSPHVARTMQPGTGRRRRALRSSVVELVGSLGATPHDIAESLAGGGVKGLPANKERCALACFLHVVVGAHPDARQVIVLKNTVVVRMRRWWPAIKVPLPPEVRSFVIAFDARCYPELIAASPSPKTEEMVPHALS